MLTTSHAPTSIASRAVCVLVIDSSRPIGVPEKLAQPRVIEERAGRERLFDAREVERAELFEQVVLGERVAPVGVHLDHHVGPDLGAHGRAPHRCRGRARS